MRDRPLVKLSYVSCWSEASLPANSKHLYNVGPTLHKCYRPTNVFYVYWSPIRFPLLNLGRILDESHSFLLKLPSIYPLMVCSYIISGYVSPCMTGCILPEDHLSRIADCGFECTFLWTPKFFRNQFIGCHWTIFVGNAFVTDAEIGKIPSPLSELQSSSFELLGLEGHVTHQHLRNDHIMGGGGVITCVYPNWLQRDKIYYLMLIVLFCTFCTL